MQPRICIALLTVAVLLQVGVADLPVHCLRHQVAGDWEFTLGPLGPKRSSCGHQKPDSPYRQPRMKYLEGQGSLTKKKMTLADPNTVTTEDGSSGTWTMIYDEGFEVRAGDLVYFAFSKFEFTDGQEMQKNVSKCGETQIGWYHDKLRSRWGCYVGRKVEDTDSQQADAVSSPPALALDAFGAALDAEPAPVAQPTTPPARKKKQSLLSAWLTTDSDASDSDSDTVDTVGQRIQAAVPSVSESVDQQEADLQKLYAEPPEYKPWVPKTAGFDKPMKGEFQDSVAQALNFLQLGWTASSYKSLFSGKTPRELNRFAGVKHNIPRPKKAVTPERDPSFTSFLGTSSRVRRSFFEGEDFDWRNKDNKNWITPVVTQGDCGSCYTISTVHMLTARNRIKTGNVNEPSFSVSFPLYCSEYNQGCDGGYGFLQSKWTEDVGLVPESCAPFSQGGGSCQVTSNCNLGETRYRATEHNYVGGYYGASDANLIRTELVEHGPLVLSFEPKEDFMYYKSGVYRSGPNKIHQEWEQVDHAVLLVGYGTDKSQGAYWTMQNSWGNDWGEDGYFRMARGTDESGCESIAVRAEVTTEGSNPVLDDFISSHAAAASFL